MPHDVDVIRDPHRQCQFLLYQHNRHAAALITESAVLNRLPRLADCPSVRAAWCDGDADGMIPFQTLLNAPSTEIEPVGEEDDTIFLFYTSGTTGRPKGA